MAAINRHLREYEYPSRQVSLALKGEEQDRFVVEVRDKQTEKVIMQFPPEALLDFSTKMREIVGVVVDQLS